MKKTMDAKDKKMSEDLKAIKQAEAAKLKAIKEKEA